MIVVDVNVIAYLVIDGERSAEARAILERDPEWSAPLVWRSEWRNVLAGYLRRGSIDHSTALENIRYAETLVRGREYVVDGPRVMALVMRSTCSAYDCEYVALAHDLDVPLVTTDPQVLEAFPDLAVLPLDFLSRS